ncbi:MAG: hypothetical protein A3G81_10915 [Betaproteobacteria bacterium RIFCSPLOWO2_12_FULL_65_14]|nr:MAG: hypothetical protein A3G81_10915 [Betaproteobacteria bacterium RIFCSPLOWO2_12_FULL_65_14]
MDCPSEEHLVRTALAGSPGVERLEFDLPGRRLVVVHTSDVSAVSSRLGPLGLGAELMQSEATSDAPPDADEAADALERRTLLTLLAINAAMFVIEQAAAWVAESTGLLADSLDMLADALVYGIALYAVGRPVALKQRAAHLSGWLQLLLAMGAVAEVLRRFLFGSEPQPGYMIAVSLLALAANVACLWIISKQRHGGVHMKASWIFSTNDVIANIGVILAAALVAWTGSRYPDLVIGAIIAAVVVTGAIRILRLR